MRMFLGIFVFVVALSQAWAQPYLLHPESILRSRNFLEQLKEQKSSASKYLVKNFSDGLQKKIQECSAQRNPSVELIQDVVQELNQILFPKQGILQSLALFYQETGYPWSNLNEKTRDLLLKESFVLPGNVVESLKRKNWQGIQDMFLLSGHDIRNASISDMGTSAWKISSSSYPYCFVIRQEKEKLQAYVDRIQSKHRDSALDEYKAYRLARMLFDQCFPEEIYSIDNPMMELTHLTVQKGLKLRPEMLEAIKKRPEYEEKYAEMGLKPPQLQYLKTKIANLSPYSAKLDGLWETLLTLEDQEKDAISEERKKDWGDKWYIKLLEIYDEIKNCEEAKKKTWFVDMRIQLTLKKYNWLWWDKEEKFVYPFSRDMYLFEEIPIQWQENISDLGVKLSNTKVKLENADGIVRIQGSMVLTLSGSQVNSTLIDMKLRTGGQGQEKCDYKDHWAKIYFEKKN